jgi:acetyl esterase/lipase
MKTLSAWAVLALAIVASGAAAAENGVEIRPDVVYGHKDGMALTYDVLRPTGKSNGAGILFMVSGGWFSRWSPPDELAPRYATLIERGYTIYLVRHGSAPRYKVPEAVADVQKAVAHIVDNAGSLGVDPQRLGVFGGSAGGHLSLMLGCATGPVGEEPDDAVKAGLGRVAAVVAYFPPVDLRRITGPNDRFPALDFDPAHSAYVSPLLHVTPDAPPTLLIHGDQDDLVPLSASEIMYAALQEKGVESELIVIEGAGHGFRGEHQDIALNALADWFDKHIGGE